MEATWRAGWTQVGDGVLCRPCFPEEVADFPRSLEATVTAPGTPGGPAPGWRVFVISSAEERAGVGHVAGCANSTWAP